MVEWSPSTDGSHDPTAHVYVSFRFDVDAGISAGDVAHVRLSTAPTPSPNPQHSGGIAGSVLPGSVRVNALEVSYVAASTPTGMTITVDGIVLGTNTAQTVGTHTVGVVRKGQNIGQPSTVILYAGAAVNQTFLGWMTQAEWDALPINENLERYVPGFTTEANLSRTIMMPANGEHMRAVWGNQRGIVSRTNRAALTVSQRASTDYPPVGVSVTVAGEASTPALGTHDVLIGEAVVLNAGTSTRQTFLGWMTIEAYNAIVPNNDGERIVPQPFGPALLPAFDMPTDDLHMIAVWGNQRGVITQDNDPYGLTLQNVPSTVTPSGQSVMAGTTELAFRELPHNIMAHTRVYFVSAGTVAESHHFLGWYRGDSAPEIGDLVSGLNPDNFVPANDAAGHYLVMPASSVNYYALWGARGIVGAYEAQVTFRAYGTGQFRTIETDSISPWSCDNDTYVVIPVVFGQALNLSVIERYLADEEDAFAFWGWFTGQALDASGRTRGEFRRPTVGTFGFQGGFGPTITAAGFTGPLSFADSAQFATAAGQNAYNLNLHAIWSLWGDVNDDDYVDIDDIDALRRHVFGLTPRNPINEAPGDVLRDGALDIDDIDVLRRNVFGLTPRLPMGQRPAGTATPASLLNARMDSLGGDALVAASNLVSITPLNGNLPAIWSISHEVIPPTAAYVNVRVRLDQIPTGGTHGDGISSVFFGIHYDPTFLSNPSRAQVLILDRSLFNATQQMIYGILVAQGWTEEEIMADAAFATAVVNTAENLAGYGFSYNLWNQGDPTVEGHDHGANIITLEWSPSTDGSHDPTAHVYVTFRFAVATADISLGDVAHITLSAAPTPNPNPQHSGGISGSVNAGSVRVGLNLNIGNVPVQVPVPQGQTLTQLVPTGEYRVLAHGQAPTDLYFGRWIRGAVVPPEGAILTEWLAERPAVEHFGPNHQTNTFLRVPSPTGYVYSEYTYTAIWVCENDIVGGGGNLRIGNHPVLVATPVGQTPTQAVPEGNRVTLNPGTAPAERYFGRWVRGDILPPLGVHLETWANLPANAGVFSTPTAAHQTNIFGIDSMYRYTAVWVCEDGYVDGRGNLRIGNQPVLVPLPAGQTLTQRVAEGDRVTLNPGTAPAERYFGRWVRGDVIPPLGVHLETWIALPANAGVFSTTTAAHQTNVFGVNSIYRYTAVWICEDGYVDGIGNLRIGNQPVQVPLPANQTLTQRVEEGNRVTLNPGTAPVDLEFGRWVRGDVIPPLGVNLEAWVALPANVGVFSTATAAHQTNVFGANSIYRYTAVWVCDDGYVGGRGNLRIGNQPVLVPLPANQTATQRVDAGDRVTLNPGTAPAERYFGRWVRGDVIPPLGVHLETWANLPANAGVFSTTTAAHQTNVFGVDSVYRYTAVWVCEDGYVDGIGNLRIGNQPVQIPLPANQTLTQRVDAGNRVTLNPGTAPVDLGFGRWVRGDVIPPLGVHLETWIALPANAGVFSTTTAAHQTNVFGIDSIYRYTAVWVCDRGFVGGGIIIDAEYGDDGEIKVDVNLPDDEYEITIGECENGNDTIVIVIPDRDRDEVIEVNLPDDEWDYDIKECDCGNDVIVTLIPPPDRGYEIEIIEVPDPDYPGPGEPPTVEIIVIYVTVRFEANGGTFTGAATFTEERVRRGTSLTAALIPTPARSGHNHNGWGSNREGITNNPLGHMATMAITFEAQWTADDPVRRPPSRDPIIIPDAPVPLAFIQDRIWYVRGFPDGSFRAGNSITRAEVSMIIFRLLDSATKNVPQANNRFSDIQDGIWYTQAINYLASHNILRGFPEGDFRPNAQITRAELTAVMSRFFEMHDNGVNDFSDVSASHWAFAYINNANNRGWVTGFPEGDFRPNNQTSRAEAVTLINRVLERIPNEAAIDYHLYDYLDGQLLFNDLTPTHWAYYQIMEAAVERIYTVDEDGNETWTYMYIPGVTPRASHNYH